MIETLSNSGASFITATHLHQLVEFDRINKLIISTVESKTGAKIRS